MDVACSSQAEGSKQFYERNNLVSDPTSIFGNSNDSAGNPGNVPQGGASTPPNVQADPSIATLLEGIKNDRGEPKYKSLPDALTALQHSQQYIPQLTTQLSERDAELARLRVEAARVSELERSIQELTQRSNTPQATPPAGMTPEQIAELVNRTLTKTQQEAQARDNAAAVATALQAAYGSDAEARYNAKAAEIGMSVAEFNALAARSPRAVLEMLGAKPGTQTPRPTTGSTNTAALQPHQDTFIGRNKKPNVLGATSQDMHEESANSRKMVEELHAKDMTVYDLTDPKVYFKYFGK